MDKYIPFLKLKSNEIMALKVLEPSLKQIVTPFFDFPKKVEMTEDVFKRSAQALVKSLNKNIPDIHLFYLDNFDVNSSLIVDGEANYQYLINLLQERFFIPVLSIDRCENHVSAIQKSKESGILKSEIVGLRLCIDDFESFDIIDDEIKDLLSEALTVFESIDLIFDCRVCSHQNSEDIGLFIEDFIRKFSEKYNLRKAVVTGSSIPASISDLLKSGEHGVFDRNELLIFQSVYQRFRDEVELYLGDYTVVSPNYSDVDLPANVLPNVMTPRIIYSFDGHHYVLRGGALKGHPRGRKQYNDFSLEIIKGPYYRGADYSFGDNYLDEKSQNIGADVMPGTIIKPSVNAHITYMMKDYIPKVSI